MSADPTTQQKKAAGEFAVTEFIDSGMLVGLGFGSTAVHAVRKLGELIQQGELRSITAIACARSTEDLARELGIQLIDFTPDTVIDVTIDGADEVDPDFNLIKGGGGALTREKIVAQASRRQIIVVDESKRVPLLGTSWPVPIEVIPFGWQTQMGYLNSLGAEPVLRLSDNRQPYRTDQGNYIIDANFGPIEQPGVIAGLLEGRSGIVEHGLFLNLATDLVVSGAGGTVHLKKEERNS